jgi:hypothetical protein
LIRRPARLWCVVSRRSLSFAVYSNCLEEEGFLVVMLVSYF